MAARAARPQLTNAESRRTALPEGTEADLNFCESSRTRIRWFPSSSIIVEGDRIKFVCSVPMGGRPSTYYN